MIEMKRILFVDDDQEMLDGLRRILRARRSEWDMVFVTSGQAALELIHAQRFDAIIADVAMPGMDGLELVKRIRDEGHTLAIVILTGQGNESVAVKAMKLGAHDYLCKGSVTAQKVQTAIEQAIEIASFDRDSQERNARIERMSEKLADQTVELSQLSRIDPLTRLFNRRAWEECITLEHARLATQAQSYCVIMLDVDHFKAFNDSYGHAKGDEALRRVADCVRGVIRATDIPGRYGGEEFVILAPGTRLEGAMKQAQRIRESIWAANIEHNASDTADRITVSLGVASGSAQRWEGVVQEADQALYASKENGRNMVSTSDTSQGRSGEDDNKPTIPRSGAA